MTKAPGALAQEQGQAALPHICTGSNHTGTAQGTRDTWMKSQHEGIQRNCPHQLWSGDPTPRGHWGVSGNTVIVKTGGGLASHGWGQRCCSTPQCPERSPQGTTWMRISVWGGAALNILGFCFCHSHPGPMGGSHSEEMEEVPVTLTAACEG